MIRRRRGILVAVLVLLIVTAGAVYWTAGRSRSAQAREARLLALVAIEVGQWETALDYLREAQRHEPASAAVARLLGLVSANADGRDLLAIAWLRTYLAMSSAAPDASRVGRDIRQLELRAARTLDGLLAEAVAAAGGVPGVHARAREIRALVGPTPAKRRAVSTDRGEAAEWVSLVNELLAQPATENLTTYRASAASADAPRRVELLLEAARQLADGLRRLAETEAAWQPRRTGVARQTAK